MRTVRAAGWTQKPDKGAAHAEHRKGGANLSREEWRRAAAAGEVCDTGAVFCGPAGAEVTSLIALKTSAACPSNGAMASRNQGTWKTDPKAKAALPYLETLP